MEGFAVSDLGSLYRDWMPLEEMLPEPIKDEYAHSPQKRAVSRVTGEPLL